MIERESYKSLGWRGVKYAVRVLLRRKRIRMNGVAIDIDRAGWSRRMVREIYKENYERAESIILQRTLSPGDRLLEIGGALGFIAVQASKIIGDDRVCVYEANPNILKNAAETFRRNGVNPQVRNAAVVSDRNAASKVRFRLCEDFWASALFKDEDAGEVIEVDAVPLSQAVGDFSPTYVMMDVEGAETDILTNTDMGGVKKLCVEIHPDKTSPKAISDMVRVLLEKGFLLDFSFCARDVLFFSRP